MAYGAAMAIRERLDDGGSRDAVSGEALIPLPLDRAVERDDRGGRSHEGQQPMDRRRRRRGIDGSVAPIRVSHKAELSSG